MNRSKNRSGARAEKASQLRIIGGQWRSRKLSFNPAPGLRPTTDRIRETLFNWLDPMLAGANCADLFAGSGALGLEALSRDASHCDFVDTSRAVKGQIEQHLETLRATSRGHCFSCSAEDYLNTPPSALDIVFVDPPFGKRLVEPACQALQFSGALSPGARIYIETAVDEEIGPLPARWLLHREKVAGDVAYRLFINQ